MTSSIKFNESTNRCNALYMPKHIITLRGSSKVAFPTKTLIQTSYWSPFNCIYSSICGAEA